MEGLSPERAWQQPQPSGRDPNVLAIVALVCSISSLALLFLLSLVTFGFSMLLTGPLAIAGLICGLVGRRESDSSGVPTGRGMAHAAFVLGIISLVLHVLAVVIGVVLVGILLDSVGDLDLPEPDNPPGPGDPAPPPQETGPGI